jgi:hypothetical protein
VFRFYLGTHEPHWLQFSQVPLFISRHRLKQLKTYPRANVRWALDSGGFTEMSMYGNWRILAVEYAYEVRRYRDAIGHLEWAAPMDYMCEPSVLLKSGRTVREHQMLTVFNFLELRQLAPELPIVPVLQGWTPDDYLHHIDMYLSAGIYLEKEYLIGIGTMCRRQATLRVAEMLALDLPNWNWHAFGMKRSGLLMNYGTLRSADSLAWSFVARKTKARMPGCQHAVCSSCYRYAYDWYERKIAPIERQAWLDHQHFDERLVRPDWEWLPKPLNDIDLFGGQYAILNAHDHEETTAY